jgi:hypothetical protein
MSHFMIMCIFYSLIENVVILTVRHMALISNNLDKHFCTYSLLADLSVRQMALIVGDLGIYILSSTRDCPLNVQRSFALVLQ